MDIGFTVVLGAHFLFNVTARVARQNDFLFTVTVRVARLNEILRTEST